MSSGNDEMEAEEDAEAIHEVADANMIFSMHCENFAIPAKFCNPSEIFAMHIFSLS